MIRIEGSSPVRDLGATDPSSVFAQGIGSLKADKELDGVRELGVDGISGPKGVTFEDVFAGAVKDASALDNGSTIKGNMLARGLSDDLHGTMIAAKEADISVKLVGSIRTKLLDAFHELWRINV